MVRLYIDSPLDTGKFVFLQDLHIHYVRNVLRFKCRDSLNVFNEKDGEWQATVESIKKDEIQLQIHQCLRQPEPFFPVRLVFAPLKPDTMHYLIEKATELGVTCLQPVVTEFTQISKINTDKIKRYSIDAAQQCERLSIPHLQPLKLLSEVLENWPQDTLLIVGLERQHSSSLISILQGLPSCQKAAFLIGPEGGFSPRDITLLSTYSFVRFCHLGPRILRAETASVAVLSCFQAIRGDWQ